MNKRLSASRFIAKKESWHPALLDKMRALGSQRRLTNQLFYGQVYPCHPPTRPVDLPSYKLPSLPLTGMMIQCGTSAMTTRRRTQASSRLLTIPGPAPTSPWALRSRKRPRSFRGTGSRSPVVARHRFSRQLLRALLGPQRLDAAASPRCSLPLFRLRKRRGPLPSPCLCHGSTFLCSGLYNF